MIAPISRTRGIVLKRIAVSNTSATVIWLTRDFGRLATLIKGAYRPKSLFLGRVDYFYTCELLFYTRNRNHLHFARECTPEKTRAEFRRRWKSTAVASYWCDLVHRVLPWGEPQPAIYDLLDAALDDISSSAVSPVQLYWFELRVLDLLGQAPRWDRCAKCARRLYESVKTYFSVAEGGVLCAACRDGRMGLMTLLPDRRALLAALRQASSSDVAGRRFCSPSQNRDLDQLLGNFLRWHLDLGLNSRDAALETLSSKVKEGEA